MSEHSSDLEIDNLPNRLTILRLAMVPVVLVVVSGGGGEKQRRPVYRRSGLCVYRERFRESEERGAAQVSEGLGSACRWLVAPPTDKMN